jgi:hypothetical protein
VPLTRAGWVILAASLTLLACEGPAAAKYVGLAGRNAKYVRLAVGTGFLLLLGLI